jgi:uncharacterized membrane protein YbhN (UPF0104 family)
MQASAYGLVALVVTTLLLTRGRWRHRLPTMTAGRAAGWAGYSVLFQVGYVFFVLFAVRAVGIGVSWTSVVGLLAASQVASVIPGIHGAGPREGVLAGGLMASGASHGAALAVVGLMCSLVWVPALLFGGTGLALRGVRRARSRGAGPVPALARSAAVPIPVPA